MASAFGLAKPIVETSPHVQDAAFGRQLDGALLGDLWWDGDASWRRSTRDRRPSIRETLSWLPGPAGERNPLVSEEIRSGGTLRWATFVHGET